MVAERAAMLTEAYRILSDEQRRAEYDRQLSGAAESGGCPAAPAAAASPPPPPASPTWQEPPPQPTATDPEPPPPRSPFREERASRDAFVQKVVLSRLRQTLIAAMGECDESPVSGFDF